MEMMKINQYLPRGRAALDYSCLNFVKDCLKKKKKKKKGPDRKVQKGKKRNLYRVLMENMIPTVPNRDFCPRTARKQVLNNTFLSMV